MRDSQIKINPFIPSYRPSLRTQKTTVSQKLVNIALSSTFRELSTIQLLGLSQLYFRQTQLSEAIAAYLRYCAASGVRNPVHEMVIFNQPVGIDRLKEIGVDIDEPRHMNFNCTPILNYPSVHEWGEITPLQFAVACARIKVVKHLIWCGANPNVLNSSLDLRSLNLVLSQENNCRFDVRENLAIRRS